MNTESNQGERMRVFELAEDGLTTPDEAHARIASAFSFPPYYGANLAALSDCLEDVADNWRIVVKRSDIAHRKPWLDGFCTVFARVANENPGIEFQLEEDAAEHATLDEILARIERIDMRLDAMQDAPAPAAVPASASQAPVSDGETCRNLASGSDGDRFKCGACGCRVSDYLEETRMLIEGLRYCPQCGREVTNPEGSNALGWVGELI